MAMLNELLRVRRMAETGLARQMRIAAGLSLTEVASAADVDRSTIYRWEHGQRRPHGDAAIRYLRVLDELGS